MDEEQERTESEAPQEEVAAEEQAQEVEIREQEPEPEPEALAEQEIADALAEANLDEQSTAFLAGFEYADRETLDAKIAEMKALFEDAGQPFGVGADAQPEQPAVPELLTAEELEKRASERTKRILA